MNETVKMYLEKRRHTQRSAGSFDHNRPRSARNKSRYAYDMCPECGRRQVSAGGWCRHCDRKVLNDS